MKDVEDHYAWSTVNIVGNGPVVGFSRTWTEVQETRPRLDPTARKSPDHSASPELTELASTLVRTDVAMRRWLHIVGAAKRDGHDAVSHRHGKVCGSIVC